MDFSRFIGLVIRRALKHSLDLAQTVLFILVILAGLISVFLPNVILNAGAWETAVLVVLAVVAIRLALAPYWLWKEEKDRADAALGSQPNRVSFLTFRDNIEATGRIHDENIFAFIDDLRQAALDGEIAFWGRTPPHIIEHRDPRPPLTPIPKEHWADHHLDPTSWAADHPLHTNTGSDRAKHSLTADSYEDLHLDSDQASRWFSAVQGKYQPMKWIPLIEVAAQAHAATSHTTLAGLAKHMGEGNETLRYYAEVIKRSFPIWGTMPHTDTLQQVRDIGKLSIRLSDGQFIATEPYNNQPEWINLKMRESDLTLVLRELKEVARTWDDGLSEDKA